MKTLLISILSIMILGTSNAKPIKDVISLKEPAMPTETYVNDIPFNTELIAGEVFMMRDGWELKEEASVNDIPFDTRVIANEALLAKLVSEFSEAEVNDIPFNTQKIYEEALMAQLMKEYGTESTASDIQFNTEAIANGELMGQAVNKFREEAEVSDIPYQTVCIISTSYNNEPAFVVVKKTDRKSHRKNGNCEYHYTIIQPYKIEISAPALDGNVLTRELPVFPGSSL